MRCTEALEKIDLQLAGDLGAIASLRLRRHVHGCRSCYAELRRARQVHGVLDDFVAHLRPETSLRDRVLREVATTPAPLAGAFAPERPRRPWLVPLAAAVAVLAVGVWLWSMLASRARTDEILARVTRIEGRAFLLVPGEAAVALAPDVEIATGSLVESQGEGVTTFEAQSADGAMHYELGADSAVRLRRGRHGTIVEHERGSVGIQSPRRALEEVRSSGATLVPDDDAVAIAITPVAGTAGAVRLDVHDGRIDARSDEGSLLVGAHASARIVAGFAPEPWSDRALPAAAVTSPPPNAAPTARSAKRPTAPTDETAPPHQATVNSASLVKHFVDATEALRAFAFEHRDESAASRQKVMGSSEVQRLVESYERSRTAVSEGSPDVLRDMLKAAKEEPQVTGPLAECADALASRYPPESVDGRVFDDAMLEALRLPDAFRDTAWQGRRHLWARPRLLARLDDTIVQSEIRQPAVDLLATTWMVCSRFDQRFSGSLRGELAREHERANSDAPYRRRVDQLLFALNARAELELLLAAESDEAVRRVLSTYCAIIRDAPARQPRNLGPLLESCARNPSEIAYRGLDPYTVLEVLWQADAVDDDRVRKAPAWESELARAIEQRPGIFGEKPHDSVSCLAAAVVGWSLASTRKMGVLDLCTLIPAITRLESDASSSNSRNQKELDALCDLFEKRVAADGKLTAGGVVWTFLEKAETAPDLRRWGIWHSLR